MSRWTYYSAAGLARGVSAPPPQIASAFCKMLCGHADVGDVDHAAVELHRAAAVARRLRHRLDDAPRPRDLVRRGAEHAR